MIASVKNAERYRKLIARTLTWRVPPLTPDATTKAITKLATLVNDYDGDSDALWALGECDGIGLSDLLSGAYAYYAHYHNGQWSGTYKALSALGKGVDGVDTRENEAWRHRVAEYLVEPESTAETVYQGLIWLIN